MNLTLTNNNTQLNIQHHFIESEKFLEDLRDSTTNTASLKQQFSYANIDSSLTLAYHENSQELFNETFPAGHPLLSDEPTGTVPLYAYISSDFKAKEFQLNWFNDAQLSDQHWIYGIEYRSIRTDDVLLQTNYDLYGGGFDYFDGEFKDAAIIQSKLERNILSVYTQVEFQPWQKNYVTIGLRYDNFNDIDNHFSPRLAWVITPSADQSIKFLYGHAFRAPTAAELNLQNTFFLGNPELEPEVVNTYELIWQTKQNLFDISVSYFENHFTDAIIRKYNTNHSLQYLNQNQDPVKGVEFELSHQLTQNTLVRVNASHFITLPDASFRESEQLFSFIVNHQIDRWNINLAASWYDESAMIINNNAPQLETLDDYWLVYAKIHYQFNHVLSAYAQVKNALDDDYLTPPESESLPNGISNRSREVMFGISYTFD